jgi:hypothetical protein
MARSVLDNIFAAYKSKTDQQTSYQPSNISSHKYTQDIIATPKMVDLCCSKMHPKFAIAAVDLTEKKKKKHLVRSTLNYEQGHLLGLSSADARTGVPLALRLPLVPGLPRALGLLLAPGLPWPLLKLELWMP